MVCFRISHYINYLQNHFLTTLHVAVDDKFSSKFQTFLKGIRFPNNYTEACANTIKFRVVICLKGIIMCWCIVENKAKLKHTAKIVKSEGMEV